MSKSIKKPKKPKPVLMNFKVTVEQRVQLKKNAKKYAKGNMSLWLVFSGLNHKPRKKDLTA